MFDQYCKAQTACAPLVVPSQMGNVGGSYGDFVHTERCICHNVIAADGSQLTMIWTCALQSGMVAWCL